LDYQRRNASVPAPKLSADTVKGNAVKSQFQLALEQLQICSSSRNDEKLGDILTDLEIATIEVERWPANFLNGLENLLQDSVFLGLKNSWKILHFINGNWDQLSSEDKERFRGILAGAFDGFGDWQPTIRQIPGCFQSQIKNAGASL
jgi:hypothetical protein